MDESFAVRPGTFFKKVHSFFLFHADLINFKGTLYFLEIGSFYNSPRVKQLSFTVFESIQPISGSGGSTFSLA